jgi:DNA-binding NtrC family response regulator
VERLQNHGLNATGVGSGAAALNILNEKLFDVAILDMQMPGMDGIETLRKMKMIKPLMEVILLTGRATVETATESLKLGAFDYLVKPPDFDSMLTKMRAAYKNKKAREDEIMQAKISELSVHPGRVFEQVKKKK